MKAETSIQQCGCAYPVVLVNLRVDGQHRPDHVDRHEPRLSWQVLARHFAYATAHYQVRVAADAEGLTGAETVWDSDWVAVHDHAGLRYTGPRLQPGRRYRWCVRATDGEGHQSAWSRPAWFETALLSGGDWQAPWISTGDAELDEHGRAPVTYVRRQLLLPGDPMTAVAYVTALGIYRLYVNGERVSDTELAPGWTDYTTRIHYQKYDLDGRLRKGTNELELAVAAGWWAVDSQAFLEAY